MFYYCTRSYYRYNYMTLSPMDNQLITFIFFNHPYNLLVISSEYSIVIHLQVQEFYALLFPN